MISKEDYMEIEEQLRRGAYKKDIAASLGVHPKTVGRAVKRGCAPSGKRPGARVSKLDAFKPLVDRLLAENVWNAVVIYRELQAAGYTGGISILRDYVRPKRAMRPSASKATVRFETEPGRQMQSDWGAIVTDVGGQRRRICFCINTLGYSRRFHFWCTDSMDANHTYEGMIRSFEYFGGATREVLVDNQKTAVLTRQGGKPVFAAGFRELGRHYGFTPRACRPYRARTKGKDESMVRYIKGHFFVRYRSFESLAHMNQLAERWLREEADLRIHGTLKQVVVERFAEEAPHLSPLPPVRFDTSYLESRKVAWDGYVDVRGNRYSVPAMFCGHPVRVRIGLDGALSIFDLEDRLIASHHLRPRDQGWSTVPAHHRPLWRQALAVEKRPLSAYEEAASWN